MNVKPEVKQMLFDGILHWVVEYTEGTTARFPYCDYGLKDAQRFLDFKRLLGEVAE